MHLTALNAKSEPEEELAEEFAAVFAAEPPEAIKWAFRAWRDQSNFFPSIAEVRELVERWKRERREDAKEERQRAEKKALKQARREGKLVDFGDLVKHLAETMAMQPEPEHMKRKREFEERMKRRTTA